MAAAADAERFYQDRVRDQAAVPAAGEQEQGLPPLAISADGKGVAMLPGGAPPPAPGPRSRRCGPSRNGPGPGRRKAASGWPRPGAVFDVAVPDGPARTPEQVMRPEGGTGGKKPPRAQNRWYACDITAGRDVTIGKVFDEADRRDPGHAADLDRAGRRGQPPARPDPGPGRRPRHHPGHRDRFHPRAGIPVEGRLVLPPAPRPGDGRLGDRAGAGHPARPRRRGDRPRSGRLAAEHPPKPGGEHAKIIRKTLSYLQSQAGLHGLPAGPGERLADRHRRHRGRLPPPGRRTGWASPAPAGAWKEPRPCSGSAPSPPAATPAPTGTGTSPKNTSATTSAATRHGLELAA